MNVTAEPHGTIRITHEGNDVYRMRLFIEDGTERLRSECLKLYESLTAYEVAEKLRPYIGRPYVEIFGDLSSAITRYLDDVVREGSEDVAQRE